MASCRLLQRIQDQQLDPCWYAASPPSWLLSHSFCCTCQHVLSSFKYNGRSSGGGNTRGGVMIRKRRPNWIDAPDDSFFLVTRETR